MKDREKNSNSNEEDLQEDIYAAFDTKKPEEVVNTEENTTTDTNTGNEVTDVNKPSDNTTEYHYEEKQYNNDYLKNHTVVTRASKASRVLLVGFYLLILVVGALIFFMLRADRYAFYLVKDEINITNGSSYQIELTPKNVRYFSYLNYDYSIDDPSVATVDEFGTVTGVGPGTTNLTISLSPGLSSKTMRINTEDIVIESITLMLYRDNKLQKVGTINMLPDQTFTLKAVVNNREDLNMNVDYSSSNTNVAKVDEFGNVTAVGNGTATITGKRNGVENSVVIKVTGQSSAGNDNKIINVTGVSLNKKNLVLRVNENETLLATVSPSNATNKAVTWSSSNSSVVSVNEDGIIETHKEGTATITVTTKAGAKKASCTVTVNKKVSTVVSIVGVSLNKTSLNLTVGGNEQLSATILPSDAANTDVTWLSSDSSIATVSEAGLVKGIKKGTVTIMARTNDGNKVATCNVTVNESTSTAVKVTGVILNKTTASLDVDKNTTLTATVSPSNATNKEVTWSSSNTSVATVSSSGVVKAIAKGTTTITVTTKDGSKKAICNVTVNAPVVSVTGVSLNKTTLSLNEGKSATLKATVSPSNAANNEVTWSSSNTSVATVSSSGVVKGVKKGTATITAITKDGNKKATCQITVNTPTVSVSSVSLNKTRLTLLVGKTETLTATVTPSDATNKAVTWSSSNPSVAKVDNNGKVTAIAKGTTTISVTTTDGGKKDTCQVTVNDDAVAVTSVTIDAQGTISKYIGESIQLSATISPSNATAKEIKWSSSDTSVATVTQNGLIKAVKKGSAVITVEADGKKDSRTINVREKQSLKSTFPTKYVKISTQSIKLKVNESKTFNITLSDAVGTFVIELSKAGIVTTNTTQFYLDCVDNDTFKSSPQTKTVTVTGSKAGTVILTIKPHPEQKIGAYEETPTEVTGMHQIEVVVE